MAGFERGVLPIGLWSISITLSKNSSPFIVSQGAGVCFAPFNRIDAVLKRVSIVNVDLPPPETPVTQTNFPKGNSALIFFKLLPVALTTEMFFPFPLLLSLGKGIANFPLK